MNTQTGFFVGQEVYSWFFGHGVVTNIRTADNANGFEYPVIVDFTEKDKRGLAQPDLRMFAPDGAYYAGRIDPKMDIHPATLADDHASLPIEWPGPVSRLLFSEAYESGRRRLLEMGSALIMGIMIGSFF